MNKKLSHKEITSREIDDLIWIANSSTSYWHLDTKTLAKSELTQRNVSITEQNEIWRGWDLSIERHFEKLDASGELYKTEADDIIPFTFEQKILIFSIGPLIMLRRGFGPDLITLYQNKKWRMFKEKLLLLSLGVLLWLGIFYTSYSTYENRRLSEIENTDISDWKEKHGYD